VKIQIPWIAQVPLISYLKALTLQNFTNQEIRRLYAQHTQQTGQVFSDQVVEQVYHYTQGQPWLVNAIAREIIVKILKNDFHKPFTQRTLNKRRTL
jgi:hypothetical protein